MNHGPSKGPTHQHHRVSPSETEAAPGHDGSMHIGNTGEGRKGGSAAVPHGTGDGAVERRMGSEPTTG